LQLADRCKLLLQMVLSTAVFWHSLVIAFFLLQLAVHSTFSVLFVFVFMEIKVIGDLYFLRKARRKQGKSHVYKSKKSNS